MTDSPSADLQSKVGSAIAEAIKDAVDWDFTEKLIAPTLDYVNRCLRENLEDGWRPFYFSGFDYNPGVDGIMSEADKPDGLTVSFCITDEDTEIVSSGELNLADLLARQYDDCFQSQAGIVWGLERTLDRLKERYREQFGIDCTREAVAAERSRRWPENKP